MPEIKCPICGELNDASLEHCSNCRSSLKPKANIQSGQAPTKKHTAELEPILPQWLKDARDASRTPEPSDSPDFLAQPENKPKPNASNSDLLAGLQSQTSDNEEEEVPDWLASITGASPTAKSAKDEPKTDIRWVEVGNKDDFADLEETTENDTDVPPWLAGLQTQAQPEKDELTDFLRDTGELKAPAKFTEVELAGSDTPDWLKQMSTEAEPNLQPEPSNAPTLNLDTPDWLNTLSNQTEEKISEIENVSFTESDLPSSEAEMLAQLDMPDWLKNPNEEKLEEKPTQDSTTPLWLKPDFNNAEPETPAWLSSEDRVYLDEPIKESEPVQDELLGDMPDWLKAAAPEQSIFDTPVKDEMNFDADVPQNINAFEEMPTFTPDAIDTQTGNLESLFTDMPDWLSDARPTSASSITPITNEDVLPSSDLPSWVEAMRPADGGLQKQLASLASDQTLESRGALAGLQGVLPAMAGFTPTSKPKAYSLKLNANDEQLKHAGILEEILAAETAPVPLESFSTLRTSRSLRWGLALLMFVTVFSTIFLKTQIFALPQGTPNETTAAIQIAQSLPENAPILVAVDYEASRAGEMEAAAAPLFDNLLLLKRPRLTLIASNETGSVLVERFIAGPLAFHKNNGIQYSNLGYLPGGQLGIRAFAQTPSVTASLDITGQAAWTSASLQGVTALNQFTAMILITDSADAARIWIEQTEGLRGSIPVIVITSAQSAPMIQPYYESGQVNGMISGLYGGAIFEQVNAGRPGTARSYWDAYSMGMLLAMALVLGGGLWNLVLGLRERAALQEGK